MTFTLPINWYDGWAEVEATLLPNIAPHLAHVATFALIRGYKQDSLWWIVTNVETGLRVTYAVRKARAIEGAAEVLARKTPRHIHAAYRKQGKKHPQCVV